LEIYNKISAEYMLVIDESHYIKNHKAIRTKRAIQLAEKVSYRYIMTGTNITNHVSDLYSQFYFLSPKILGYDSWYKFRANHLEYCKITNRVFKSHNVDYLSQKISPYTYQCNIDDVLELPDLTINDVFYEVSEDTKNSYHKIKEKIINEYTMLDDSATNFVYLLFTKLQMEVTKDSSRADYCLNLIQEMNANKIIVWCKYNHEIEMLSELLEQNDISYSIFNGQYKQLDQFENDKQVLLANIQTGGVSHNMQFCNYAIYYSSSFNYAGMRQSQGRIYRNGQQKKCLIYYIKSSMKIEKLIFKSLAKKSDLLQDFIKLTQRFNKKWLTQYLQENL
jgi:SNF2 family DNA or RNA helicase